MPPSQWFRRLLGLNTKKTARLPRSRWSSFHPALEHLEVRLVPATTITILAASSGGSLDSILSADHGVILATDGSNTTGTLSAGALAALPGTDNISIVAQNSIVFNNLTAFNSGGILSLRTQLGHSATFNADNGSITFNNTLNTLATAHGGLDLNASANLTLGTLETGGTGNVNLIAGSTGDISQTGTISGTGIAVSAGGNVGVDAVHGHIVNLNSVSGSVDSTGSAAVHSSATLTVDAATGITLNTNAVSLEATNSTSGDISITQLAIPAQTMTITGTGVVNHASTGTVSITNLGASITVSGGSTVKSTNGNVTLAATDLQLNGSVSSGTARTTLTSVGGAIHLGTNAPGTFGLTQNDLSKVTASVLQIGSEVTANITVSAAITHPTGWSILTLVNGGTITEAPVGSLTVPNLRISSTGPVTLGSVNDVGNLSASTINAFLINNGTNTLTVTTVDGSTGIATDNSNITLMADNLSLANQVNSGTGMVTLKPSTTGHNIDLGTNPSPGNLGLKQGDLDNVTAGLLVIGSTSTGAINFSQNITDAGTGWTNLSLENGAAVMTQTGGALSAATLSVLTSGHVNLIGGSFNRVPTIAASIGGTGVFNYDSAISFVVGTTAGPTGNIVGITDTSGSVTVEAATGNIGVSTLKGTTVNLNSVSGSVDSTGSAAVHSSATLTVDAATGITLNTNAVSLEATNSTSGDISITQLAIPAQTMTITGTGVVNHASTGTVSITNLGASITVSGGSTVKSTNGNVTLAATDLQLNGSVSSGTARTTLTSVGGAIHLGTNAPGTFGLTQNDLSKVTASVLQIGSEVTANITVSAAITHPTGWSILTLVNGGTITEAPVGSLTVPNLRISSTGPVTLGSVNDVGNLSASTINAFLINNGTNTLTVTTVDGSTGIATDNSNITLMADNLSLANQVNSGTGMVTLKPSTTGHNIDLGTNPSPGNLGLKQGDLDNVTAGLLVIGSPANTGNISVSAPITSAGTGWTTLSLIASGAIVENGGMITANQLALLASKGIGSTTALQTKVSKLAFQNGTSGAVQITNSEALTIASLGGLTTSRNSVGAATLIVTQGSLTFGVSLTASGDLDASTTGVTTPDITVNGGVTLESTKGNVILSAARSINEINGAAIKSDTQAVCFNYNNSTGTLTLNGSVKGTAGAIKGAPVLANNQILPVASMAFTTQPSNTLPNPAVMSKVVVTCYDRFGNTVPRASVFLTLQTGTTLTGTTTVTTNAQGQAVFTNLRVAMAGKYTFLASVVNTSGFTLLGVYEPTIAPKAVTKTSTTFTISDNPGLDQTV